MRTPVHSGPYVLLNAEGQPIQVEMPQEEMEEIAVKFHTLFYSQLNRTWANTFYMGKSLWQAATDLWIYQELIWETEPDLIIETGTGEGGCALYFAHLLDNMGIAGKVVTVDVVKRGVVDHPRVVQLLGSSVSPKIMKIMREEVGRSKSVIIFLDSSHAKSYVLRELRMYSKFLKKDEYLVVEDTNTVDVGTAMREFLSKHPEFAADLSREKFFLTFHPSGYLRRRF